MTQLRYKSRSLRLLKPTLTTWHNSERVLFHSLHPSNPYLFFDFTTLTIMSLERIWNKHYKSWYESCFTPYGKIIVTQLLNFGYYLLSCFLFFKTIFRTGFMWLRKGLTGRILWTQQLAFGFQKWQRTSFPAGGLSHYTILLVSYETSILSWLFNESHSIEIIWRRVIDEWWIGRNIEGCGTDLTEVLSRYSPRGTKENYAKYLCGLSVSQPKFETSTSRIYV
jgi:hypothetical protein